MENLNLVSSENTPEVRLDKNDGKLLIKGRSLLANPSEFYLPLYNWIDTYCERPLSFTIMEVMIEYFNTSSAKCFLELFKRLERLNSDVSKVEIHWYYQKDNEDMFEAGEDFQTITRLPFKMIEVDQIC